MTALLLVGAAVAALVWLLGTASPGVHRTTPGLLPTWALVAVLAIAITLAVLAVLAGAGPWAGSVLDSYQDGPR